MIVLRERRVGRHTPFAARELEDHLIIRLLVSAALGVCVAIAPQGHAAGDSVGSGGPTKTFVYKKTKQAELEIVLHFPPSWKASDRRAAIVFFLAAAGRAASSHNSSRRRTALGGPRSRYRAC